MDNWDYFLTIHSQNKQIFKIKDDVFLECMFSNNNMIFIKETMYK